MSETNPSLQEAVARLAQIGSCFSPSFSADGCEVAFLSDLSGVFQVWIVPVEGGFPRRVTPFNDPIYRLSWSPDGQWIAFLMALGGGMNAQVYLARPDGSGERLLTDGGQDNNTLGPWMHDSHSLSIASNRDDPQAMDVYLIDIESGGKRLALKNQGIGSLTDVSRDGRRAILYRKVQRGDSDLFMVGLDTGEEHRLTPHEGPGNFDVGKFSPDGRSIYLTTDAAGDRVAFGRVDISQDGIPGPIEVLVAREDADLEPSDTSLVVSPDGREVGLVWNVAGQSELTFWDTEREEMLPAVSLPAEVITELTYSPDGRFIAFTGMGAAAPRDIWLIDRATGEQRCLTESPHPGVNLALLARPELVRFSAHDGLELTGWLFAPRNFVRPGPLVLTFHGGPEGQARPVFNATIQALVAVGIAVFLPNVRGSTGFGKRFVNLDNGALRFNAVRDIEACVRYVSDSGVANPQRIGIMGGSYGGYMTMAGLAEYPQSFAAGANLFGVVNFETFFQHTEPWMAAISKLEYGDPETQADLLRKLSPIHRIDQVRAPTLVLHGANDTNVPVVEAEQVVAGLQDRGVPVKYVLFPDEGHGFVKESNRIQSATAIVDWFRRYL